MKAREFPGRFVQAQTSLLYTLDLDLGFYLTQRGAFGLGGFDSRDDDLTRLIHQKGQAIKVFANFWFMDAQRTGTWPLKVQTFPAPYGRFSALIQRKDTDETLTEAITVFVQGLRP